ncbi:hypothetical protein BZG36_03346 [Bifiguratus adelaidae]|uniref:Uncharacterized protein n=1 Tax=Bifiguratus adelaidae TaxID=1938954 RepID=A0A261XWL9_9FUNG|nr:hypothetical protein BZG36_03346 [Bifiguratus adelaidae]
MAQTYLITGTSRGIGLAVVKQLIERGDIVIAGARQPEASEGLKAIRSPNLHVIRLDVSDTESIANAVKEVDRIAPSGLDVLINNAAALTKPALMSIKEEPSIELLTAFKNNSVSVLDMTRSFIPALMKKQRRLVINVSSQAGSMQFMRTTEFKLIRASYAVSKAAVNMLHAMLSGAYEDDKFTFISIHPGAVETNMNSIAFDLTPDQSAEAMIQVFDKLTFENNGDFLNYNGEKLPW